MILCIAKHVRKLFVLRLQKPNQTLTPLFGAIDMPCMCWFTPSDEDKKYIKDRCVKIVAKIKEMEGQGDPDTYDLSDTIRLIKHLYRPDECEESEQ